MALLTMLTFCIFPANAADTQDVYDVNQNDSEVVITISGEENIRKYLESIGEEYDPTLLCIQRRIKNKPNSFEHSNSATASPNSIFREYVVRNKRVVTYTDCSLLLKEYRRPAGRILIDEGINISTTFSADAGITVKILETCLNFSVQETHSFRIEWKATYTYPVKIQVYPIYEKTSGEIWDDDVWEDDFIGKFIVKRPIGDDILVYRA